MSFVFAVPEMVAATASDLASLGAALSEATAAAAIPTTQVLAAAADEVSAAIAELFGAHGQEFQALSAQASAFHDRFVRALSAAAGWYVDAEAANAALVDTAATGASELGSGGRTALILSSTGTPRPPFDYMQQVYDRYIAPHYLGYAFSGLYTPAQFQPWTGIPSLTYDQSVAEGAGYLHTAIMQQVAAGNDVVVLGFSQGASVATLEMRHLASLPAGVAPSPDQLSFVLLGNPNNPNGGILARFPGLYLQSLGLTFNGATPDTDYATTIYTTQYDGFADFPKYPLNILADVNALLGIYYSHSLYYGLTPEQVASGIVLPVSSPDTNTTYILLPNEDLPLLQPLRGIVPEPLLDLIEPDLRAIIELGYDRTGYADVPTPAALFPVHIDPIAVPPQIGAAIGGPLTALDGLLDTVINDQLNPVVTSGIYQAGAELSVAAAGYGAPAGVTNAIFIGQQVLPILVEGPGALVTADTHYLVDAIQDLAAGDLSGFNQNLQLIPATNIALLVFAAGIPAVAAVAILTGQDFPV